MWGGGCLKFATGTILSCSYLSTHLPLHTCISHTTHTSLYTPRTGWTQGSPSPQPPPASEALPPLWRPANSPSFPMPTPSEEEAAHSERRPDTHMALGRRRGQSKPLKLKCLRDSPAQSLTSLPQLLYQLIIQATRYDCVGLPVSLVPKIAVQILS